jgi:hypothetical protein
MPADTTRYLDLDRVAASAYVGAGDQWVYSLITAHELEQGIRRQNISGVNGHDPPVSR